MKKIRFLAILSILVALLLTASSQMATAQVNNGVPQKNVQHLTFQGIPITGSMDAFCAKLKQKGYKFDWGYEDKRNYQGKFAGYDTDVKVYQDAGIVYSVHVIFGFDTQEEANKVDEALHTSIAKKYPRAVLDEEKSGRTDDETHVYYAMPRPGKINYKNLLGYFCIETYPCTARGYRVELWYIDEYNSPEWREARRQYIRNSCITDNL